MGGRADPREWAKNALRSIGRWASVSRIPWGKRYALFAALTLVGFAVWVASSLIGEQRLVGAIHRDPSDGELYRELMLLHSERAPAWPWRGQAILRHLAKEYPDNPWPSMRLAENDRLQRPYRRTMSSQGFEWAEHALQATGGDERALANLALLYLDVDEAEKAKQAAERALTVNPDDAEALYMLGWALKRSGDLRSAEEAFRRCADTDILESEYGYLCYRELVAADREIEIVLHADRLELQTNARLDISSEVIQALLRRENPSNAIGGLTWGIGQIGSRGNQLAPFSSQADIDLQGSTIVASSQLEISYQLLWMGSYSAGELPCLTIQDLPLASYTRPTTITVVAEGASVVSTTHPYRTIEGQVLSWRLDEGTEPGSAIKLWVQLGQAQQLKLAWTTDPAVRRWIYKILWASPTILGLVALARYRRAVEKGHAQNPTIREGPSGRADAQAAIPWWIDPALWGSGALTVLYPLWLEINGSPYTSLLSYYAYLAVVAFLAVQLLIGVWRKDRHTDAYLTCLGVIIFACYLVPRLVTYQFLLPRLVVSLIVGWFLLTRNRAWQQKLDWSRLRALFSAGQEAVIDRVVSLLDQVSYLRGAERSQKSALAKGSIKVAEYLEQQPELAQAIREREDRLGDCKAELGIPAEESWRGVLFALGPTASPPRNGLISLGFGLIPYVAFLVLGSLAGNLFEAYQGGVSAANLGNLAFDIIAVPWGPMFAFFFGCFFHALWGRNGSTKGLAFGSVLVVLNALWEWLWFWDQVDGVALWGISLRILVTFVFIGALMDWTTVRFSWKRMRVLYDSPAVTTIVTVLGTALTTLVTGLLTGTLNRLLSIALQSLSMAFQTKP